MNNTLKITLGLIAGGTLVYLAGKKKKAEATKVFTAPDGNTYGENQVYRTIDNKMYRNGKEIHYGHPEPEQNTGSATKHYTENGDQIPKNYQAANKNTNYHQKGVRHH
ncbi:MULTISPECIES: hypothetical protein [Chryseobacterium]|uniref:YtxH domain-containing protein n=1 Tax=Chryseobacterium camelliae TaxID=1265445 RepID=A0ABU0TKU7_9FLAO|nr:MULTISPECIES: hypothetical protein [Chryseobacterium]MDT3409293.1 hypothetical protein [Pseudacidovorax intermedius]MDQ1096843.1 hypothetical protein [Chryseobacterium camelliae]MDQ1100784.1 hypothetical protein [Chryseobacterium sp. SORGH_AS_1048]MDR6084228.1 hypothetical protein [Chryseobacterium sp. SORGH_AS_0909]MDR6132500.1 hypothetical protein [Chryseobacterium sp. SORGH_AS_1175]